MSDKKVVSWFTMKGKHIPIYEGESKDDAVRRSVVLDDEAKKQADIKRNKEEADKLNSKKPSKETATTQTQSEHKKAIAELNTDKYEDGTYDISTKKPVEFGKGFQVTFCQIGDDYSDEDYAKKVNECLKNSSDGKTYAGKFESTPEISFHWNDRDKAIAYAKANNQISIWDWESMDVIPTGGTGERKKRK